MLEEILNEIINEAKDGRVIIDGIDWPIAFNTIINNGQTKRELFNENNNVTLRIINKKRLVDLLEIYVPLELQKNRKTSLFLNDKLRNQIKTIILYLFINATTEDFMNPERLVERNISFIKDTTYDSIETPLEIQNGKELLNTKLRIKKSTNSVSMETPYRIDMDLVDKVNNEEVVYHLPSVYYGIQDGVCYIYSIMAKKDKVEPTEQETKFRKKINRILYKLNQRVGEYESQEYYDYISKVSSYYPEDNITDITHSFLLSLQIFISMLQSKKIKTVKVVSYLPLRYQSRELTAKRVEEDGNRIKNREKSDEILTRTMGLRERNDQIQNNVTNKLIRTFRRLSLENPNITIEQYPYEFDKFLVSDIRNKGNAEISNDILKSTSNELKTRTIKRFYD